MKLRIKQRILGGYFDLDSKKKEIAELEKVTMELDFWNSDDSKKVVLKLNELKKIVSKVDGFSDLEHSLRESLADSELLSIVAEEIENLSKEVNDFEILTLLNKEADSNNCILEIHSGAGVRSFQRGLQVVSC